MKQHVSDEYQYLDLLKDVLEHGVHRPNRTGIGTVGVFGRQIRFDLSKGFPLLTTKKMFTKAIIHELLWFLKGSTNIKYLVDNGVRIWNEWPYKYYTLHKGNNDPEYTQDEFVQRIKEDAKFAEKWGELGPVYGKQWRRWAGPDGKEIDQLGQAIETIKKDPNSRRILISAWNPTDIPKITEKTTPPLCHTLFQYYVADGKLSCMLFMRSNDLFLGAPFNIASYSLLTMMIAQVTGLQVGDYVHATGDTHIYDNHIEQVKEQIKREPRPFPKMKINPNVKNIDDFKFEDFTIEGYDPHPTLKGVVAV